jgi:hypothetical protein
MIVLLRRLLTIGALSLWFGGFTFYSAVVIHVGHHVLGSRTETGFITQQVTHWLNLISIPALLILLWNTASAWPSIPRSIRLTLAATLAIMLFAEVALFIIHPMLDRLLDPAAHEIIEPGRFRSLHKLYMNTSTVQWSATIAHMIAVLLAWRMTDRTAPWERIDFPN